MHNINIYSFWHIRNDNDKILKIFHADLFLQKEKEKCL